MPVRSTSSSKIADVIIIRCLMYDVNLQSAHHLDTVQTQRHSCWSETGNAQAGSIETAQRHDLSSLIGMKPGSLYQILG
jgi:hypothetical protein